MISKQALHSVEQIEALAASIHEIRLRLEAKRMGCSYATRRAMETGHIELSNAKPWRILAKQSRKRFERFITSLRPPRRPLSQNERHQLARMLGFSR